MNLNNGMIGPACAGPRPGTQNPPRPPRTKQRNTQSKRTSNHARERVRRRSEPCSDQACIRNEQRPIGGRPTQRRLHQTNKHKPSDTRRKQSNEQSVAGLFREPAMTRQPLRRVAAASLDVLNAACASARTSRLTPAALLRSGNWEWSAVGNGLGLSGNGPKVPLSAEWGRS